MAGGQPKTRLFPILTEREVIRKFMAVVLVELGRRPFALNHEQHSSNVGVRFERRDWQISSLTKTDVCIVTYLCISYVYAYHVSYSACLKIVIF